MKELFNKQGDPGWSEDESLYLLGITKQLSDFADGEIPRMLSMLINMQGNLINQFVKMDFQDIVAERNFMALKKLLQAYRDQQNNQP